MAKKPKIETVEEQNAAVLTEICVDPQTTEHVRVQVLNKLLRNKTNQNFFDTMLEEVLDLGECPNCGHMNNWLIPETELNQRGIVTSEKDKRVKPHTKAEDCPQFEEACAKKKTTF